MPNTGMMNNQTYKCDKCRQNFNDLWLPTNICCQISKLERDAGSSKQASYSRYATLRPTKQRIRREIERLVTRDSNGCSDGNERLGTKVEGMERLQRNKLAPFSTLEKATCGFNFSRDTDNRKKNFGILPSNLVKWRSEKMEKVNMI